MEEGTEKEIENKETKKEEEPKIHEKENPDIAKGQSFEGSKDYFKKLGLSADVSKNSFTEEDAISMLRKAADDLESQKVAKNTVKHIINQAWGLFKILM